MTQSELSELIVLATYTVSSSLSGYKLTEVLYVQLYT